MFANDPAGSRIKVAVAPVDAPSVVALFAIFGALLASCGVGLVGLGIGMLSEGNSAGIVGVACGLPVCYGGYLFGRAAFRVRRGLRERPLNSRERRSRRRKVRFLLSYTASSIGGAIALPAPGAVRVLMVIGALLVVPVISAREFEPAKRHESPDPTTPQR